MEQDKEINNKSTDNQKSQSQTEKDEVIYINNNKYI